MRRSLTAIILVMTLCVPVAGFIAWPYYSAQSLREGLEAGDVVTVNRKVHWPSVRASIKNMLSAEMMRDFVKNDPKQSDAEKMGAGFAAMLAPVMLDRLVDSLVTPQGIIALISQRTDSTTRDGGRTKLRDDYIRRASLAGPTRFEIELGEPTEATGRLLAVMEFKDFDWKLTQLFLLRPFPSR